METLSWDLREIIWNEDGSPVFWNSKIALKKIPSVSCMGSVLNQLVLPSTGSI